MPFTFSHPAVVLPLTFIDKKRLSVTALTIGSITPDFEYFANFKQHSIYSHKWLGILWFDLPIAIALFYVYIKIVKNELIDNLPAFLNRRFSRFKNLKGINYSTQKMLIVLVSLLIGITSHLIWDKTLHKSASLVEEPIDFYPIFRDENSVVGAAVIGFLIWKLPKSNFVKRDTFLFWFLTLLITLIVLIIRSVYSTQIGDLQISVISGFLIGLLISSVIVKVMPKLQTL